MSSMEASTKLEMTRPAKKKFFSWSSLPKHVAMIAASLTVILPVYFMLITAFKTRDEYTHNRFSFPSPITVDNFQAALRNGRFFLWFGNSTLLCLGAVVLSVIVSALAAYAFARMRFSGQSWMQAVNAALMVVPPVVMIIPMFIVLTRLTLINTYAGAIIVYAGLVTPFSIYMLTNFFRTIPQEIVESALMDGASTLQILTSIISPLATPALVTLTVVNTVWIWNDLLVALILLNKDNLRTLMVGITIFGTRFNSDVPISMAGMLLASLPMLILYLAGQRYFIKGLVAGALKG